LEQVEDDFRGFIEADLYEERKSEDRTLNSFGRNLLSLCNTYDLKILNGCTPGDLYGLFTYVSATGSSTIDYFILSRNLVCDVKDLKLEIRERFESQHLPLHLTVNGDKALPLRKDICKKAEKMKWDKMKCDIFLQKVCSEDFSKTTKEATELLKESVEDSVECFTKGLVQAAQCMTKTVYLNSKARKNRWYDRECNEQKGKVRKAWRLLRRTKDLKDKDIKRKLFTDCRKIYRNMLKIKKQEFKESKIKTLIEKVNDSKAFWEEIKSLGRPIAEIPQISCDEWFQHFRSVLGANVEQTAQQVGVMAEISQPGEDAGALDVPITREEIERAIRYLKCGKSPGCDRVIAEMLKTAEKHILPFLEILFNHVFENGSYPQAWAKAVIVPIHKGGDKDNPDKYRGVSLLSLIGKVFASVLNKRLSDWADENNTIVEEQGGFRAGYSTNDNIFVLYSIVQKYFLKRSGKVYVCFVDFRRAFDTIDRSILWDVLRKSGIQGKMLQLLRNMYSKVKSCVRCPNGEHTDFFGNPRGVRQGCVLSPILFSFLVNELAMEIKQKGEFGIQLSPCLVDILIVLFADDVFLASYTAKGLQKQINLLYSFAINFKMEVNLEKTKIIVFRKGGFLAKHESWKYGDEQIQVVNSYKYLGLFFSTKLSMSHMMTGLASKAKMRTNQIVRCLYRLGNVHTQTFFKLFDAQVVPILLYGSELWGFQHLDDIEKVQRYACKRILNVSMKTPNAMVLGELGRFPLYVLSAVRCIKYWLKILSMPERRLPKMCYNMLLNLERLGKKSWAYYVRQLLCVNGFGDVWQQQGVGNENMFIAIFKQRLIDQSGQNWHATVTTNERYELYASFKSSIKLEKYLTSIMPRSYRDAYIRFRFGISPILSHKMRHRKDVLPHHLLCPICKSEIEDEEHVLFHCREYESLRKCVPIISNCKELKSFDVSYILRREEENAVASISKFLYDLLQARKLKLTCL
jgi:hypothetical protein